MAASDMVAQGKLSSEEARRQEDTYEKTLLLRVAKKQD
jgi:hypothetical protein